MICKFFPCLFIAAFGLLIAGCGEKKVSPVGYSRETVISGQVRDGDFGMAGVCVNIAGGEVDSILTTGADGAFRLTGIPSGLYLATPVRSGYRFTPENMEIEVEDINPEQKVFKAQKDNPGGSETVKGILLVAISSGSFQMGFRSGLENEQPVHSVALPSFFMSATEITQKQYGAVMGKNPSYTMGDENRPVEQLSWIDAAWFCNRLSDLAGRERCYDENSWECNFRRNGFRLPTEAEWEYSCRAGTSSEFYTGDAESELARAGWYFGNSNGMTLPVGEKEPNAWGLYDMHGNVWEWCNDRYSSDYYSISTKYRPTGSTGGTLRVLRGGSRISGAFDCRSAFRGFSTPDQRYFRYGFRIVCNR